ncbi:MAG: M24 family metallopeptidase [Deltaproteobacteria bacterium]|nr:MAG: M24 family metallopeptidase [Deltaproteobacteria bacterium]
MGPVPDFAAHRQRLIEALGPHEAVLLFSSPHPIRNGDAEYRYRPDSDLYWLTGWTQPEAALLVRHGESPFTLFVQPKNEELEIWTGYRPGPTGAVEDFGLDAAFPIEQLPDKLLDGLQGISTLHYAFGRDPDHDALLKAALRASLRKSRRTYQDVPHTFKDPAVLLHELRLRKGPDEIEVIKECARITEQAFRALYTEVAPGVGEWELDALLTYNFRREGGSGPGYTSIVAAGHNACILHYIENDQVIEDGDLVLVDAGAEYCFYTADVTRTFPASGRYSRAQRQVVEVVLRAQEAAFAEARATKPYRAMHEAALRVLVEGMISLGLLEGEVDARIEDGSYKRYYMHGTGHWLGLDVHDVGLYHQGGASRPLEPGMVVTVEPGLYIAIDDDEAPEALRGIGVRIEDDVLITEGDPIILTEGIPKTPDEVEALCRVAR